MSFISTILGRFDERDPRTTHQLYKVPVTITLEIPVAAPTAEIAVDPAVLTAALPHIINDLESAIDYPGRVVLSVGTPSIVTQIADLSPSYQSALPYEHPSHRTSKDLECQEWCSRLSRRKT